MVEQQQKELAQKQQQLEWEKQHQSMLLEQQQQELEDKQKQQQALLDHQQKEHFEKLISELRKNIYLMETNKTNFVGNTRNSIGLT
jgi:hypothetical protein